MRIFVVSSSLKRLRIAIALSLISLSTMNQFSLSSRWLDIVVAKIQREGRVVVDGDPYGLFYTIRGTGGVTFTGVGCRSNGTCRYLSSRGAWVDDPELNQFLGRACRDQNDYSVVCNLGN